EEEVSFLQSIKLTLTNKSFLMWLLVFSIFFFGLQMFLSGQNVLASGPMGLNYWQITIINTAAFAPVPLMLYFYRKIMKKKGFRFAFQTAMGSFAVAMLMFSVAYIEWIPNEYIRLAIAATGATIGSYGLGAFFSAPYAIPSQAAADELKATGKSHPSMYFAMQGLCTALVGALSTSIVWLNIKEITLPDNPVFGAHLMPYIVMIACVVAIIAANFMPKEYNEMGKEK
ncbi:MAG TPA: MFS transporter, partial [Clostridia bacterium]|nr:MFS transporter [Clostridia bacterium]